MPPNLLVTTEWLTERLDDPTIRIVDIRGHVVSATEPPPHYFHHREAYLQEHIPGSVFIDWVRELTDPNSYLHASIAPPERFGELMSRMGIGTDTLVVAYDDAQSMFAARVWWSLNYYGHDKVVVLDGGWDKWIAEDRPTESHLPDYPPADFVPRPNPDWIRTSEQIFEKLNDSSTKLLDLRSALEFTGQIARTSRKGRIPGSINKHRRELVAEDGTLLPADQLREIFTNLGIDNNASDVITYCNTGVSASFGLLALRVAGITNSAVYDGSWKDWGHDESHPVE